MERASVDEAYLDITKEAEGRLKSALSASVSVDQLSNTFVEGWGEEEEDEKKKEKGWYQQFDSSVRLELKVFSFLLYELFC